jgi:hypothetical protein
MKASPIDKRIERLLSTFEANRTKRSKEVQAILERNAKSNLNELVQEMKESIKKTKEQLEQI